MSYEKCTSCAGELQPDFVYCPYCGIELGKPITCPKCSYENEHNSKFCQECGTDLVVSRQPKVEAAVLPPKPKAAIDEIEPPPSAGITIEFPYSTAQSFDFAVKAAMEIPTFRQFGEGKKAIYRATFNPDDLDASAELVENLKGWRKRIVYVNGEKSPWDSVFSYSWCYRQKSGSFKPDFYCFGYENDYDFNIWGCIQARMPFVADADWFCYGKWLNKKGDWEFDKDRIQHELQKNLFHYRFCPALQTELVEDVLQALPSVVNPSKNKSWQFIEDWGGSGAAVLVVTTTRHGYKDQVKMKGVGPKNAKAVADVRKSMKLKLPKLN